jgi:hypothetical protein
MANPWNPFEEVREWHAAATDDKCLDMEAQFRAQGLDISLVDTEATGDDILGKACIFDGPDSNPEASRWPNNQGDNDDD